MARHRLPSRIVGRGEDVEQAGHLQCQAHEASRMADPQLASAGPGVVCAAMSTLTPEQSINVHADMLAMPRKHRPLRRRVGSRMAVTAA